MNTDEIMERTGDAYMNLLRPEMSAADSDRAVSSICAILPEVTEETISKLITAGPSWRERLVGLVLAIKSGGSSFVASMIESCRTHPTGLAFVPTFAALVVCLGRNPDPKHLQDITKLDRNLFDGDLGWSIDKFLFHVGITTHDPGGRNPSDGRSFEANLEMFRRIRSTQQVSPRY